MHNKDPLSAVALKPPPAQTLGKAMPATEFAYVASLHAEFEASVGVGFRRLRCFQKPNELIMANALDTPVITAFSIKPSPHAGICYTKCNPES